jgi:hypothetical protein
VLVANALDQPAQDPLGLTRAQFDADPWQTNPLALPQDAPGQADRFDTRKDTAQTQAGAPSPSGKPSRWRRSSTPPTPRSLSAIRGA